MKISSLSSPHDQRKEEIKNTLKFCDPGIKICSISEKPRFLCEKPYNAKSETLDSIPF